MSEPLVRVVAVTYSPGDSLGVLLSSLAKATLAPYEVVLADNGSTDGMPEQAAAAYGARLLHTGGNLGYGRAANAGAEHADAPWLLIINPDVRFCDPGALDELIAAAERWPQAGALGPAIVTPDGQLYPSARALPSLGRGIGHALAGWWWPSNPWTAAYRQERLEPSERPVGWLSGSCLLLRRQAFDAITGFDERYFMYMEDVDLGDRLTGAGWLNVYAPSAEVLHDKGHSTGRDPARNLAAHHTSTYTFLADRHSGWRQAPLRWTIRAALAARVRLVVGSSRRRLAKGRTR